MFRHQIIADIRNANPTRSPDTLNRRLLKILEELGESSEAYLSRTSRANYKQKTWEDYREEAVDILIVLLDVALTRYPNGGSPGGLMVDLHLTEGKLHPANSFADMERMKFEVARAVCSADHYLRTPEQEVGFLGAMARGIRAAAGLCYAKIPNQKNEGLEQRVYDLIKVKVEKWINGSSTAEMPASNDVLTIVPEEVIDQEEYLEQLRDRHT